jgi:hypothetical protein
MKNQNPGLGLSRSLGFRSTHLGSCGYTDLAPISRLLQKQHEKDCFRLLL